MKKCLLIGLMIFCGVARASAQSYCDTQTDGMLLPIPDFNTRGFQWGVCMRNSFSAINSSAAILGSGATSYFDKLLINEIGALSNTDITVSSATTFVSSITVGGASLFNDDVTFNGQVDIVGGVNTATTFLSSMSRTSQNGASVIGLYSDNSNSGGVGDVKIQFFTNGNTGVGELIYDESPVGHVAFNYTHGDNAVVVNQNNNVGINTTSPLSKFSVDGDASISGATTILSSVTVNVGASFAVNSGNVGIGTASPAYKLDVSENLNGNYGFKLNNTNSNGDGLLLRAGNSSSNAVLDVKSYNGLTSFMRVRGDGNVGIGTASPETILHANATAPILTIEDATTVVGDEEILGRIDFQQNDDSGSGTGVSGSVLSISNSSTGQGSGIAIHTGTPGATTEKFRVESSGNVGIGTTSPGFTLDVAGEIGGTGVAGEYTAVASTDTNIDTADATSGTWRWMRLGNQVNVAGQVLIDITASGDADTDVLISLPVASDLTSTNDASGQCTAYGATNRGIQVLGDIATNTVRLRWMSDSTATFRYTCNFMYEVK